MKAAVASRRPTSAQRQVLLMMAQADAYLCTSGGFDFLIQGDRETRLVWNTLPALLRLGWVERDLAASEEEAIDVYVLTAAGRAWT